MTTSTDPTDAVVSISWQESSGGVFTAEQGSGVLIAPDEVLTAAHLVYDAAGRLVTGATVSSAAGGGLHAVGVEASVHAMPLADWTQVGSAAGDFALIHLAAPVAGLPTMALGSDFAGGTATVSGFPRATPGAEDSAAETLAPYANAAGILQGTPLGAPGDAHGASGGPAWQVVGGVPTVVGLTSSASGSTGFFAGLTAADVAEIGAWMAADHAAPAAQPAAAQPAAAQATAAQAPAVAAATSSAEPSPAAAAVGELPALAAVVPAFASHPAIDAALSRVVGLLARDAAALGAGANFDDAAADVLSALGDNSAHRNLAAALLEGMVWGHDGGGIGGAVAGVAGDDPGLLSYAATGRAVRIGAVVGQHLAASGY